MLHLGKRFFHTDSCRNSLLQQTTYITVQHHVHLSESSVKNMLKKSFLNIRYILLNLPCPMIMIWYSWLLCLASHTSVIFIFILRRSHSDQDLKPGFVLKHIFHFSVHFVMRDWWEINLTWCQMWPQNNITCRVLTRVAYRAAAAGLLCQKYISDMLEGYKTNGSFSF